MAFLIGILDKSALFNKDQMDCHTITTVVACNLMVLLFRRNLPMPGTPLKNNSDQQTERHFQALMLVIQDWAAADTAWVNAGTFFSADPDACNTGTVLMFANVGSVRILMVITLHLRRMAPRMVDEVEATMEATIISNHRRSMSIIFPTILDQDLAMAEVGILIQMDADNMVTNLLVAILLVMIPTMEMEDQTDLMDRVDQTGQVDLAGLVIQMDQADQGGQGGQIATELAPGADANVDADLVFLMTAFLAIVGIMEHPLPRAAGLWHSKVTLPTR